MPRSKLAKFAKRLRRSIALARNHSNFSACTCTPVRLRSRLLRLRQIGRFAEQGSLQHPPWPRWGRARLGHGCVNPVLGRPRSRAWIACVRHQECPQAPNLCGGRSSRRRQSADGARVFQNADRAIGLLGFVSNCLDAGQPHLLHPQIDRTRNAQDSVSGRNLDQ